MEKKYSKLIHFDNVDITDFDLAKKHWYELEGVMPKSNTVLVNYAVERLFDILEKEALELKNIDQHEQREIKELEDNE